MPDNNFTDETLDNQLYDILVGLSEAGTYEPPSRDCFNDLTLDNQLYQILLAVEAISGGGVVCPISGECIITGSGGCAAVIVRGSPANDGVYWPLFGVSINGKPVYKLNETTGIFFENDSWHIFVGIPVTADIVESSDPDNQPYPWMSAWAFDVERATLEDIACRMAEQFAFAGGGANQITMSTDRLIGRTTAGTGPAQEISVGTGLLLSGGTLSATTLGTVTAVTATAPLTSSGGTTPDISTSMNTDRLIGRTTAGTGVMEEISTAGTLTLSAGTLTGTGVGGSVGAVDNAVLRADVGTGIVQNSSIIIDDETTTTQNNVAIRNNDSQTNSALVLTPKGTGAFILGPKPDGTATGGNARGAQSVDLQLLRTTAGQVSSGTNSFCAGRANTASNDQAVALGFVNISSGANSTTTGQGNTASNANSFAGGGRGNLASGDSAIVLGGGSSGSANNGNQATAQSSATLGGQRASADRAGMHAHAMGQFAAIGDAQRARFVLRNKTTTNAAVELFLDGSTTRLTIPSGKVLGLTINITGIKSDGSAVAHYLRQYCLKNVAGTTSEVYAPVTIGTDNAAGTSIALSANDTNDALKVEVTGITSETWRWVASVDAVEIAYGT